MLVQITHLLTGASRLVASSKDCQPAEVLGYNVAKHRGPFVDCGTAYQPIDDDDEEFQRLMENSEYHSQFRGEF